MDRQKVKAKMMKIIERRKAIKTGFETSTSFNHQLYFLNVFEDVLNDLNSQHKLIIEKTFINTDNNFWWLNLYSKSTFYRLKDEALNSFVNMFEMIYENIKDFAH